MRKRLSESEAKLLGFDLKLNYSGYGNPKYEVNEEQIILINNIRKKEVKETPLSIIGKSTLKDANGKTIIEWTKTSVTEEDRLKALKTIISTLKEDITPTLPTKIPLAFSENSLCNQYTLTDYHFGMMSWAEETGSSVWLREILSAFYEDEPRLKIDTNPDPYYCIVWGKNCLFYHHGHKRNLNNIDTVFVSKFKKEFGLADFIYGHIGHLHNQQMKETNLMVVEQHRTLASKDAYASRGGWASGRDSKVITYHKNFGEVGRLTININMLSN